MRCTTFFVMHQFFLRCTSSLKNTLLFWDASLFHEMHHFCWDAPLWDETLFYYDAPLFWDVAVFIDNRDDPCWRPRPGPTKTRFPPKTGGFIFRGNASFTSKGRFGFQSSFESRIDPSRVYPRIRDLAIMKQIQINTLQLWLAIIRRMSEVLNVESIASILNQR